MSGGVPYLGSKISLVSKSEIRYEGILYTIDTKESTVALAKVRSFGTEGRPTDRPVAPRDEIYEYIIFRASDIKDLHVCEPPKSQMTLSGLPNDPAIVQHSPPVPYSMTYGQPSFGALCGLSTFQHYPGQSGFPHISTFFPTSHISGSRSGTQKKNLTMDAGVQVSGNFSNEMNKDSKSELYEAKFQDENLEPIRRNAPVTRRQPPRQRGSRRPRSRGRNAASSRNQNVLKFDCDYDFEQANAEFQELENKLAKTKINDASETPDESSGDIQSFYDKQKSFFDNISCEASQRNARFDWRQERKLNVETFGVPRSNSWMRRRRGRGAFRNRGGFRNRPVTKAGSSQKSVKFEDDDKKPIEIAIEDNGSETAVKESEIPTIELIVEKDKDWEDPKSETKSDWK